MSTPVLRGIVCPIVTTPTSLSVTVGDRGTTNAGRLILGITVDPRGGVINGANGLAVDECFVQMTQFKLKENVVFSNGLVFTQGLV